MNKALKNFVAIFLILLICLVQIPRVINAESTGDYRYTVSGQSVTIEKYTGPGGAVAIPENLGGFPVTDIGNGAFFGTSGITSLEIPDSVVSIGEYAFSFCTTLIELLIPRNVSSIGQGAFLGCDQLRSITVDPLNSSFSSTGGVLFNRSQTMLICYPEGKPDTSFVPPQSVTTIGAWSFSGCANLVQIILPDQITSIGENAFANCTSLLNIALPDELETVGDCAFWSCTSLESVSIAKNLTSIGSQSFVLCQALESIDVTSDNRSFTSIGGILFDKKISTIFCYPAGQTAPVFNIPDSITTIGENAFNANRYLTSMTIPDSVVTINWRAFKDCTGLRSVTLSQNVARIGMQAFAGCTGLTSMAFPASIYHVGEHAFSGCPLNAAYFYGEAPTIGYEAFHGSADTFEIYYIPEKNGFTPPTLYGYRTALFSPVYTVLFDAQNKSDRTSIVVAGGNLIPEPALPEQSGRLFVGWYRDQNYTKPWNFETDLLESDVTLFARWMDSEIKEANAKSLDFDRVNISWLDDSGCDFYEVSRATSLNGPFELIGKVSSVGSSYIDDSVKTGNEYYYQIRGYSICGMNAVYNAYSKTVSARPIPARPENFMVSRISPGSVQIIWSPVDGANGYEIYRATSPNGAFVKISDNLSTNYLDESIPSDLEYCYKVRSCRQDDTSIIFGEFSEVLTP